MYLKLYVQVIILITITAGITDLRTQAVNFLSYKISVVIVKKFRFNVHDTYITINVLNGSTFVGILHRLPIKTERAVTACDQLYLSACNNALISNMKLVIF